MLIGITAAILIAISAGAFVILLAAAAMTRRSGGVGPCAGGAAAGQLGSIRQHFQRSDAHSTTRILNCQTGSFFSQVIVANGFRCPVQPTKVPGVLSYGTSGRAVSIPSRFNN